MSAETFITDKVNRFIKAMDDFGRTQHFHKMRAMDGEGFPIPLRLDQKLRIEERATEVRDALRDLVQ